MLPQQNHPPRHAVRNYMREARELFNQGYDMPHQLAHMLKITREHAARLLAEILRQEAIDKTQN